MLKIGPHGPRPEMPTNKFCSYSAKIAETIVLEIFEVSLEKIVIEFLKIDLNKF